METFPVYKLGRCDGFESVEAVAARYRGCGPGHAIATSREVLVRSSIKDVAREAGVAVSTASRAFNGSGPVSEETKERVMAAARRLRYVPNDAARSLITRRTRTLGVLLPDLYGEFYSEVIRGIDGAAHESGYHFLVSGSHEDQDEIEGALLAMQGRVDGLVIMSPDLGAEVLSSNLPRRLPVALINSRLGGGDYDVVDVANYEGVCEAVEHLLALGHRRVGLVGGIPGNHDADERQRAFRDVLCQAGCWRRALEVYGGFTDETGYEAATDILARRPRPTALFVANDAMAVGVLHAALEAGLRVPDDISIIGFDDIPIVRYLNPPLTTVHVPISELGRRAVQLLLRALDDGDDRGRRHDTLPTRLVVRASTGPVPDERG